MNADNYFQSDEILNIINKNYNEKIANLRVLNSFKTLYDITGKYEKKINHMKKLFLTLIVE